jgi:hypothetical protein
LQCDAEFRRLRRLRAACRGDECLDIDDGIRAASNKQCAAAKRWRVRVERAMARR